MLLYIQREMEKRSIFVMLLIAFLCISTLLLAEPTVASVLWGIVSAAGTVLSFISLIWVDMGDLDDQINDLKWEIYRLDVKYKKHHNKYVYHKQKRQGHLDKVTEYEGKITTAAGDKRAAETLAAEQKYNYLTAKQISDLAYNRYTSHYDNCSICQSDMSQCSEGTNLYNLWSSKYTETSKYKKAWDDAKAEIETQQARINSAKNNIRNHNTFAKIQKRFADAAKKSRDKVGEKINVKVADKKAKKKLRDDKEKERKKLRREVKALQNQVKAVEAQNPDGYAEALESDSDLKEEVERLLEYDTEE